MEIRNSQDKMKCVQCWEENTFSFTVGKKCTCTREVHVHYVLLLVYTPSPSVRKLHGKPPPKKKKKFHSYVTVQVLERRNFFWKKCFQLLCADKIVITVCWNILKWMDLECFLTFGDFAVPKFFLHDKIIDKTQTQKKQQQTNKQTNKQHSAHCFGVRISQIISKISAWYVKP